MPCTNIDDLFNSVLGALKQLRNSDYSPEQCQGRLELLQAWNRQVWDLIDTFEERERLYYLVVGMVERARAKGPHYINSALDDMLNE